MKKIAIITLSLIFVGSFSLVQAQQTGIHEAGTGISNPELREAAQGTGQGLTGNDEEGQQVQTEQQTRNQGEEQQIMTEEQAQTQAEEGLLIMEAPRTMAKTITEVREMIQERKQEMQVELEELGTVAKKVYQDQNKVREAVHALLASKDILGGIGEQVSEIAREFNSAVQDTIQTEEKIKNRNMFVRLFIGGDEQAAEKLEEKVFQNTERVEQLKQLRETCDCTEEVGEIIDEQIQKVEEEQERLQQVASEEKNDRGIFGWFRNLFRFNQ